MSEKCEADANYFAGSDDPNDDPKSLEGKNYVYCAGASCTNPKCVTDKDTNDDRVDGLSKLFKDIDLNCDPKSLIFDDYSIEYDSTAKLTFAFIFELSLSVDITFHKSMSQISWFFA